jgi:cytochrome oxidase Cu insertion factor (SCO1/SenC/PrrC family)
LSVPLEELMKWKKAILQLLLLQVSKYVKDSKWDDWTIKEVDVSDAEKILKMFKTELGEPATIWANYNMNANKVEWLTDEESEALDILFSQKIAKPKKSSN